MARKEKKEPEGPSTAWLGTYGDMITLMLCFFVMLYNPTEVDAVQMAALTASISGDPTSGGQSLSSGRLADLGNTINFNEDKKEKGKKQTTLTHYSETINIKSKEIFKSTREKKKTKKQITSK